VHLRTGPAQWLSEGVATAGLMLVVMGCSNPNEAALARRGLDRRRLLVYGIDLIRKPGNYHRALTERHLCGHCVRPCTGFYRSPTYRRVVGAPREGTCHRETSDFASP
jgi:hypothetical protein